MRIHHPKMFKSARGSSDKAAAASVQVRASSLMRGNLGLLATTNDKVEVVETLKKRSSIEDTITLSSESVTSSSDNELDEEATVDPRVALLHKEFPSVTLQECQRFLAAATHHAAQAENNKDDEAAVAAAGDDHHPLNAARQQLTQFVEWRSMYGITSIVEHTDSDNTSSMCLHNLEKDREDWATAWKMMWSKSGDLFPPSSSSHNGKGSDKNNSNNHQQSFPPKDIPQYLFTYINPTNPNEIMIQILAARIEVHGASPEQHSLAVNLYLDRKFQRMNAQQTATLCLDVRAGPSWTNATVFTLSPIISAITHHAVQFHPQRIIDTVVFPIPSIAVHLFHLFKKALPPVVGNQMRLVAGSERNCPSMSKIAQKTDLNLQVLEQMEVTREICKAESSSANNSNSKASKWW